MARHNARCDYSHSRGFAHAMDGTINLNSTTTNESDAGSSGSPILGVFAAVAVVVVVLRAIVQSALFPQLPVTLR